jgi:Na+-transporting NADH:ubiquinone oxidoreductase subunit NqrD
VAERSVVGTVRGIPMLAAVLLALVATAFGVVVDLDRSATLGLASEISYVAGCVLTVCWVRGRSPFVAMVQPPLLLAVLLPVTAIVAGRTSVSGGLRNKCS